VIKKSHVIDLVLFLVNAPESALDVKFSIISVAWHDSFKDIFNKELQLILIDYSIFTTVPLNALISKLDESFLKHLFEFKILVGVRIGVRIGVGVVKLIEV